jgi:hypothetical protein
LQHSLLLDFGADGSVAASVVCGADFATTLAVSALEEPPQHEADMIDLHIMIIVYLY